MVRLYSQVLVRPAGQVVFIKLVSAIDGAIDCFVLRKIAKKNSKIGQRTVDRSTVVVAPICEQFIKFYLPNNIAICNLLCLCIY